MEHYISFISPKRIQAKNDFEKDFCRLLNTSFQGKTMKNDRIRIKIEFVKKDENERIIKQQSKLTADGGQKFRTRCDSYSFKQNEVLMDKPNYLGVVELELTKLLMYETYYKELEPFFGDKKDKMIRSIRTHLY